MTSIEQLELLTVGIKTSRQINYCNVAGVTVMVLDWILTFEMEVSLVWSSEWNFMKVLYLLTRYLMFIAASVILYHQFGPPLTCKYLYEVTGWMFVTGTIFADAIFTLRTWVILGKGRKLGYCLLAAFFPAVIVACTEVGLYLHETEDHASPISNLLGCISKADRTTLSGVYILTMVYMGILLVFVLRKIWQSNKQTSSPLMTLVYRDGVLHCIYLFGLHLVSIIVTLSVSDNYINLLLTVINVMYSVLACRVVLHIREQARDVCVY